MSSVSKNGVLQAEYLYNALGQQVVCKLWSGGVLAQTIHVVHDLEGNRIAEYDAGTATLLREYVWLEGRPLAVIEGGQITHVRLGTISAGRSSPAARDRHRGVRGLAGGVPALRLGARHHRHAGRAAFAAETLHRSVSGPPLTPGQWFRAGEPEEESLWQSDSPANGLHQNWHRDYDPTTGRYMQPDPLGLIDGASIYGYARQNPARYVDPTGEVPFAFAGCVGEALFNLGSYFNGLGAAGALNQIEDPESDWPFSECVTSDDVVRGAAWAMLKGCVSGGLALTWGAGPGVLTFMGSGASSFKSGLDTGLQ